MEQRSMTALISAFARWYHSQYGGIKVFDDTVAGELLLEDEKNSIATNMGKGIAFFHPTFEGTEEEALRWIVDHQLSPSPLGRAAFAEWHLQNAVYLGATQYLILASGYDSFAYRQPEWASVLNIFEVDHPITAQDKAKRLETAGIQIPANVHQIPADFNLDNWIKVVLDSSAYKKNSVSFCSMLGISYYLSQERFEGIVDSLASLLSPKSSIVFDYPDQDIYTDNAGERAKKQRMLAGSANEAMLASYAYTEMEKLLEQHGFLIYEHLCPEEITSQWFARYNHKNPKHSITAFDNVNYCLAVKR